MASTPEQTRLLEARDFEQQPPGTILQDFEALLSLMGDQGLPVTPTHLFAMNSLETINRRLAHPLELRLKRAMQKSYPHISGLNLLLRASGMSVIDASLKQSRIRLDPVALESWRSLNAAERYFALLKVWWGYASEDLIGEHVGRTTIVERIFLFIKKFPKTGMLEIQNPQDAEMLRYYPGHHNLALMDLFGLLEIQIVPPAQGQGWQPKSMRMTDWGRTLIDHYMDSISPSAVSKAELVSLTFGFSQSIDTVEWFEKWSQAARPLIEAWRKDLEIPAPSFQPGPHVFKVSLGKDCWRRIAIRGNASLDPLAATILDAFEFDRDHLYRFSYRDRFGRIIEIDTPDLGYAEGPCTDEVKVGDIPLFEGMQIEFLFDFGDNWKFTLHTESVNATELTIKKPRVLETHGEAPEQYEDLW